jgi:hypothetical protein
MLLSPETLVNALQRFGTLPFFLPSTHTLSLQAPTRMLRRLLTLRIAPRNGSVQTTRAFVSSCDRVVNEVHSEASGRPAAKHQEQQQQQQQQRNSNSVDDHDDQELDEKIEQMRKAQCQTIKPEDTIAVNRHGH